MEHIPNLSNGPKESLLTFRSNICFSMWAEVLTQTKGNHVCTHKTSTDNSETDLGFEDPRLLQPKKPFLTRKRVTRPSCLWVDRTKRRVDPGPTAYRVTDPT